MQTVPDKRTWSQSVVLGKRSVFSDWLDEHQLFSTELTRQTARLLELTWPRGGRGASSGLLLVAGRWCAGVTDGARLRPQHPQMHRYRTPIWADPKWFRSVSIPLHNPVHGWRLGTDGRPRLFALLFLIRSISGSTSSPRVTSVPLFFFFAAVTNEALSIRWIMTATAWWSRWYPSPTYSICVYMSVCACVFVYHTLAFKISMDSFLHYEILILNALRFSYSSPTSMSLCC